MGFTSSRRWVHYRHKKKWCQVFFLIFFSWGVGRVGVGRVGVGRVGVGRVGVGRVGVGARVGMGAGWIERAEDGAGWIGIVAVGCARIASLGFPIPKSDCRLGCDR